MAQAENTISISRPVKDVFQFILDGENNKLWRSSVISVDRTTKKPDGVGAVFQQTMKGPCGRKIAGDYLVTVCENNSVISFQVTKGPARPFGTFSFEKEAQGTKLTFRLQYQPKGFARLMEGMINKTMQSEVVALRDLKTYLEAKK